jgi:hypothetical protein
MDVLTRGARAAAILLALLLSGAGASAADDAAVTEYGVKAAFLSKFPGYVEWPAAASPGNGPVAIGVVESDSMADELARVASARTPGARPVVVRKLRRSDPLEGLQVLFVGRGAEPALPALLRASRGLPLLVVTESDAGLGAGGMINFVVVDNKVRFDVALRPAEAGSLKISSRLLAVARKVVTGDG